MRRVVLFVSMLLLVLSLSPLITTIDTDGDSITETNTTANIYVMESNVSNQVQVSMPGHKLLVLEEGSAEDLDVRERIVNGTNLPAELNNAEQFTGGRASIFVFVFGTLWYMGGMITAQPVIIVDGMTADPSSVQKIRGMELNEHYFVSGQSVRITTDNFITGTFGFDIRDKASYIRYVDSAESDHLIPLTGNYSLFVVMPNVSALFVTYTMDYEPVSQANGAVFGYIALIIGFMCILPVFIFGRKLKIKE